MLKHIAIAAMACSIVSAIPFGEDACSGASTDECLVALINVIRHMRSDLIETKADLAKTTADLAKTRAELVGRFERERPKTVAAAVAEGFPSRFVSTSTKSVDVCPAACESKISQVKLDVAANSDAIQNVNRTLSPISGELMLFADGRTACPRGYSEPPALKGMMLTAVPTGGKSGTTLNKAFAAGEAGRVPPHTHAVTVNDQGHSHGMSVSDPGHSHHLLNTEGQHTAAGPYIQMDDQRYSPSASYPTSTARTGIRVSASSSRSNVHVSVSSTGGEGYPLAYVLVCQKQP